MNSLRSAKKFCWGLSLIGLLIICLSAPVMLRAQDSAEDNYNKKCAVCHAKDGSGNTAKGKKVHVKDVHTNMKDSEAEMIKAETDWLVITYGGAKHAFTNIAADTIPMPGFGYSATADARSWMAMQNLFDEVFGTR